jgi:dihydrofolate synthase/folylpolyglutamate synthase
MNARPATLDEWLEYQQRVHLREIDLGLDRVRRVWHALGAPLPAPHVITVGGTNGKGSTVAFLEAMLAASGKRVGAFTSPHLLRYNERIRIDGRDVDDRTLVEAFERIEAARAGVPLTYFEFSTLAALLLFAAARLDVALLEVGLGGRLDAVNLIDADASIVTTVDIDHQEWLGKDRDTIGREKAGIFRAGRPAIVGDRHAPGGLLGAAAECGARLLLCGRDFDCGPQADCWRWSVADAPASDDSAGPGAILLPDPALDAPCQIDNASAAIAALHALRSRLGWDPRAIAEGVRSARAAARLQRFAGPVEFIVDVAHNPQAARTLASWLRERAPAGRTHAVFGALADKDVEGIASALAGAVDLWHLAGLDTESPRGLAVGQLDARMRAAHAKAPIRCNGSVEEALAAAFAAAHAGDRVIAFGSFFVATAALRHARSHAWPAT